MLCEAGVNVVRFKFGKAELQLTVFICHRYLTLYTVLTPSPRSVARSHDSGQELGIICSKAI